MSGTILITGASGGFGFEFARQLEKAGHRLILHGRDVVRLQMCLEHLQQPERHRIVSADIGNREGIESLLDAVADEKRLSGLINNAGFGIWGAFEMREVNLQAGVIETDLTAPVVITHRLLPRLFENNGFVINVSSLAGEAPLPFMATYCAAKAGFTYWSEALRTELAGRLRIVTLAPGPSPTGFRDVSGMPFATGAFFRTESDAIVRAALSTLHRGGGYCIPSLRHRLLWLLQCIVPRRYALRIMARNLKP